MSSIDTKSNVYFNVTILPTDPLVIQGNGRANFSVTRTDPIIERASDYELAVVRFSIPTANIPLSFDEGNFKFRIETPSEIVESTFNVPNTSAEFLYGRPALWNYSAVVTALNDQIASVWAGISGATGSPPVIIFDSISKRFTFYFPTAGWTGDTPNFQLSFAEPLFFRLGGMRTFVYTANNTIYYRYISTVNLVNQETINGVVYTAVTQDYSTLSAWSEFTRLRLSTSSIPVSSELDSAQVPLLSKVISDFAIDLGDGGLGGQTVIFEPTSELRFYALESNQSIRTIDLQIEFLDRSGQAYPIILSENQSCLVKILFRRKGSS